MMEAQQVEEKMFDTVNICEPKIFNVSFYTIITIVEWYRREEKKNNTDALFGSWSIQSSL